MKIIGIELRKPSFNEVTASAVLAAGLWLAIVALWRRFGGALDAVDAGGLLLVMFWACVGARLGIRIDLGPRHVGLYVAFGAALLGVYRGAILLLS